MAQWLNGSMAQIFLLTMLGTTVTAANSFDSPLFLDKETPPSTIYIDEDIEGGLFSYQLTFSKREGYNLDKKFISEETIRDLEAEGFTIQVIPENKFAEQENPFNKPSELAAKSSTCPVPSNFSIGAWQGITYGNRIYSQVPNPQGKSTQFATFEFETIHYRGKGIHNPLVLFFKNQLHGWGAFFGDNRLGAGCGSSAQFNSQIEGWAQLPPPNPGCTNPPSVPNCSQNWQSKAFTGSNSCGNEMYDNQRYRMTVHSNTNKWVYYKIEKQLSNGAWQDLNLTAKQLSVSGTWYPWLGTPPLSITGNNGIAVLASVGGHNLYVNYYKFNCGWF